MKKSTLLILGLLLAALVGAVAYFLRPKPVAVAVVAVERGAVASTVSNTRAGTVNACRRAGLAPAFGGQMVSLPVKKGQHVETGQVLVELWNVDLKAQLLLAQRDAVAAKARARESCVRADVAQREADRLQHLLKQNLAAEEETDQAVGNAQAARAGCAASREAARVSEAKVKVAEANLERTILRAPFDGVIAEINGELGEYVTPSPVGIPTPPTVDLIDSSCLYISAPIDEVDAPQVRAGQPASITMDAFPDRRFPGRVRRVAPYVSEQEKQARTVEIEADILDPQGSNLLPGYSADVEVMLGKHEDVLRVPTQVIVEGSKVLVLGDDGIIHERAIERGLSNWEYTEITDGLKAGELVVLSVDREGVRDGAAAVRE